MRPFHADHGWLAAVLPAEASTFRVLAADIAATLEAGGAEIVEHDPDVEIGPLDGLSGEAPVAIANIDASPREVAPRLVHAARRIAASTAVRVRAERARRELRRHGYRYVAVLPWDRDQVVRLPGLPPPGPLAPAERFPCRAVIVGSRRPPAETAFERAVSAAGELAGRRLIPAWPFPRAGGLVALCDGAVLRVASGPAGRQIEAEMEALQTVAAADPGEALAGRVPRPLGAGRFGITRWSLERRLEGLPAPDSLDAALLGRCVDFLVALHRLGAERPRDTLLEQGAIVEDVLPADRRASLRDLARRADQRLGYLPRGFAHGDFCTSNLLVDGGQLTGVVDWEAAGSGALPGLDLLHLYLLAVRRPGVYQWGDAIVSHLRPLMQGRGDAVIRGYMQRLDLEPDPATLEALVIGYWLDRVSHLVGTYVERRMDRVWIERNVTSVLDALTLT